MKRTWGIVWLLDFIFWLCLPVRYGDSRVSLQIAEAGSPGKITILVLDPQQRPMPGLKVISQSYSGTTPAVMTDASGYAIIGPAESEVTDVEIAGRWFAFENRFPPSHIGSIPSCTNGLTIKATFKKEMIGECDR